MELTQERLNKISEYAKLLVSVGLNIQKGQPLYINATVDCTPLVRALYKHAYELGASEVKVNFSDDVCRRLYMENSDMAVLENVPQHVIDERMYYVNNNAAFLSLTASSPELMKGVDQNRIKSASIAGGKALNEFRQAIQSDEIAWCVAGYPSKDWAELVFPGEDDAEEKLLDLILYTVRTEEEDPTVAWKKHTDTLDNKAKLLNEKRFKQLKYSAPGTDLTIDLPEGHLWAGASSVNKAGTTFVANMPTEEVFTVPSRTGVNGTVKNTMPLSYGGNIIDDFTLTFVEGKVTDYQAGVGEEVLKSLLETDEGAMRLGEVALVPDDSPISNTKTLFYNTLFDENASCHLALGSAYSFCLEGGKEMTEEQLIEHDLNQSITHEDFMVGSNELNIEGVHADGSTEMIMKDGNFVI